MKSILCRQLSADEKINKDQLTDIAEMIYDTDPYIYPAMFNSKSDALVMIPEMIKYKDRMFRTENMFVAEQDNRTVGLILWHRGPLIWDDEIFCLCASKLNISVSPHFINVREEYFSSYSHTSMDIVSIINVCVLEEFRGKFIGEKTLKAFLNGKEAECELFVLGDNKVAIHLYEKMGFQITSRIDGFSIDDNKPECMIMKKFFIPPNNTYDSDDIYYIQS